MASLYKLQSPAGQRELLVVKPKPISGQTIQQTMERLPRGARRLAAQLRTPIHQDRLWSVLTDYDRLSLFIPNLSISKVLERKDNRVRLRQVGIQQFIGLRFSAEVEIELVENREGGLLRFNLIKGDFRRFEGSWTMKALPNGEGTCLIYELTVQGCIGMPVSLIEQRLRHDLSVNLLAVEKAAC